MTAGPSLLAGLPAEGSAGRDMHALAARIFPFNRSITGDGVRRTLGALRVVLPLDIHEVPTGTPVLDWTVPREWNIRGAWIADSRGRRIVDVANHSLHVVNYSAPVRRQMTLAELEPHLHSLPDQPDLIVYRTAFYQDAWGFCLPHRVRAALAEDTYEVVIDTTLSEGALTYGDLLLPGETQDEVLLSTHICHPSLANDNCSGLALLAWLGRHLAQHRTRLSYRLVFVPATIGAITWLARNRETVSRIKHGLVLSNVGDGGGPTYKRSRQGRADIDRAAALVLAHRPGMPRVLDFAPIGYDERQYNSPGFNLPVGLFQRGNYGEFAEYHTSADNLDFIRPENLESSLRTILEILDVLEGNATYRGTKPFGEPQLGRRGLYHDADGTPLPADARMAQLWVLNLADGRHSLLDVAERAGLSFAAVRRAADRLSGAGLLEPAGRS